MLAHPAFNLDWNLVRTFAAVAQAGSLAAGARSLGITHPTAARHIQLLEEGLGTSLFTRSGRGLVLNDMGAALQAAADEMHASALAFQNQIETLQTAPVRSVRIGVAELLAELLPDLMLAQLGAEKPATTVDMLVSDDVLNLLQRDADMAVRHDRPDQQELICRRVGHVDMGLYASRAYFDQFGPVHVSNVAKHRFIDGLRRERLQSGAERHGVVIADEQIVFRSDSLACQRAAVRAGWGVAALPVWMSRQEPDWVEIYQDGDVLEVEVWLVARPEVRDHRSLKALFTDLGEALQSQLAEVNREVQQTQIAREA
ncbi:MAG: LysR family transcriptional regulator [Pseudomonadota bacterium]